MRGACCGASVHQLTMHTTRERLACEAQAAGPTLSQFCRKCGSPMIMRTPPREKELRHVCSSCAYVDYYNPKMVGVP